jgi:hypothetical protein
MLMDKCHYPKNMDSFNQFSGPKCIGSLSSLRYL